MLKRKTLILIAVLLVCFLSISFYIFLKDRGYLNFSSKTNVSEFPKDDFSVGGLVEKTCAYETFEYYDYKITDPLWKQNNKFGLYIYAEVGEFMNAADELVNSKGGEWGYVLIPFNVKDDDYDKWNEVFEDLNSKKLIPIIQLWDVDVKKYKEQTDDAAEFLDQFLWPIKYRYISVYNEMNDAKFWYGEVDPKEYARVLDYTISSFKKQNSNFFMMNGAFNISARTGSGYLDALDYMNQMDREVEGIFDKLDGWASHPYPQPNFSGNVFTTGRNGIRAYEVELAHLKTLGVKKDLPVFITETGWAHAEGETYNDMYLPVDQVSENFVTAYNEIWLKDDRVRAVAPFTVWYNPPHDHFSWLNRDKVPYKHYDAIKKLDKIKGEPPVLEKKVSEIEVCE